MLNKEKLPVSEIIALAVMECICVLAVVLGFLAVDISGIFEYTFSYTVLTGALLGAVVSVLNFLFLCNAVNRGIDQFLELRGDAELDEEQAAAFAEKHSAIIQGAVQKSMIVRTASIAAVLIVAFITEWFDPIATVIPILMYRPLMTWGSYILGIIKGRMDKRCGSAAASLEDSANEGTEAEKAAPFTDGGANEDAAVEAEPETEPAIEDAEA